MPEKEGFFRRVFGAKQEETRSIAVPNMTTNPPTWADFADQYAGRVTIRQALAIPAVQAAHRSITTAVSQLSMTVERSGTVIDSSVVRQPDANRSQSAFFKRTTTNLFTHGNAYWRLYRNSDGAVVNMESLAPSRVMVRYDDNGTKFYEYTDAAGRQISLTNNLPTQNGQVEHIKLFELEDELLGMGPIQLNNEALYSVAELRWYTGRFLRESRRPSGIYSFTDALDPEEAAHTKQQIMANRTTGEPDILHGGVKYQSVMVTPEEAQLVDLNKQAVLDVARIFGVPARKLEAAIEGNSMTYQNVAQADMAWVRESLEGYLTAIEDAMTNVLPRGQVAKFDTENWLRSAEAIAINQTKETASDAA